MKNNFIHLCLDGLVDKFFEIIGFVLSSYAIMFAFVSMYNTLKLDEAKTKIDKSIQRIEEEKLALQKSIVKLEDGKLELQKSVAKLEKYKFQFPDINIKIIEYKFKQTKDLKFIIEVLSGIKPRNCRIEYVPIFRYRDENQGSVLTKKKDDFSYKITRVVKFKKYNAEVFEAEIFRVVSDLCKQPSYLTYCNKLDSKEAELVQMYYRFYGDIGLGKEILIKDNHENILFNRN